MNIASTGDEINTVLVRAGQDNGGFPITHYVIQVRLTGNVSRMYGRGKTFPILTMLPSSLTEFDSRRRSIIGLTTPSYNFRIAAPTAGRGLNRLAAH